MSHITHIQKPRLQRTGLHLLHQHFTHTSPFYSLSLSTSPTYSNTGGTSQNPQREESTSSSITPTTQAWAIYFFWSTVSTQCSLTAPVIRFSTRLHTRNYHQPTMGNLWSIYLHLFYPGREILFCVHEAESKISGPTITFSRRTKTRRCFYRICYVIGHRDWVTAIATTAESPDMILSSSRGT